MRRSGPRSMAPSASTTAPWTDLKFGVRYQTHERSSHDAIAQGPTFAARMAAARTPRTIRPRSSNYPSDFSTFGGNIPSEHLVLDRPRSLRPTTARPRESRSARARVLPVRVRCEGRELGGLRSGRFQGRAMVGEHRCCATCRRMSMRSPSRRCAANTPGAIDDLGVRAVHRHSGGSHV